MGATPAQATSWFEQLWTAYSEPHRSYHTTLHIAHMLSLTDQYGHELKRVDRVELVVWFHDVVYKAGKSDEDESAELWQKFVSEVKLNDDTIGTVVHDYIIATKTHTTTGITDAVIRSDLEWFLDIDLAVLAFHPLGSFTLFLFCSHHPFDTSRWSV